MKNAADFVMTLLNAGTAAHVAHLQTKSYAAHMALGKFYESVVVLADDFAEAYQGCYGTIDFKGSSFKLEKDPVKMLSSLKDFVKAARSECDEPSLQNIIDGISALIASTLFLLSLK